MNVLLIAVSLISLFICNVISSVVLFLTPRRFRKRKDIKGQIVLITGAGKGLGRQLAVEFSKHSTWLVLLDIDEGALLETSRLTHETSRTFKYVCDVSNRKMVYAVAKRIKDEVGEVRILVNNAGVVRGNSLIDLPDEQILKTMEINALAHFWICKAFLPSMMALNRGHIVSVASLAGFSGLPKLTDYCASKHAAVGFAESLELEMKSKNLDGIKVTVVSPAHVNTGLFDGFKWGVVKSLSPKYVAKCILDGVLEEKEFVFVPKYLSFFVMLKSISPRWLSIRCYEMTHAIKAMDDFTGRNGHRVTSNMKYGISRFLHQLSLYWTKKILYGI